ncbi:DeoR/GlpR family DNA-binding transcription regulator [Paenibacillus sp. J2TS4]|uniref:DeoR/GlpR family DNA-binding transcription regulator n=1 Tax=Paenibacillus sp. J2TS4 TaxID=2807194 RepID=UPI001B28FE86|nr:DeoR/GlpR family DNA-binding transcription regulator [Paenibacillus sp. J2TS4]GIP33896.1 GntR family transcriptional regulator [Paenibacillus sp. J2TS4]
MFAEERQIKIVEMVTRQGKVTVAQVSEALGVSPVTIRRDLERLEEKELLIRTHGGAMAPQPNFPETAREKSFFEKAGAYTEEKERIAETAARHVGDEESILLTPGTTNMLLARRLAGKNDLTVVTNAVNIASQLGSPPGWDVIMTGGKLRAKSFALVGPLAEQSLAKLNVDKLFLGVDGFDFNEGLTTPNLSEASVNRQMIEIAKKVIVVADRSKFGKVMFSHIAPLDVVHTVITDRLLPEEDARRIEDLGIELILV